MTFWERSILLKNGQFDHLKRLSWICSHFSDDFLLEETSVSLNMGLYFRLTMTTFTLENVSILFYKKNWKKKFLNEMSGKNFDFFCLLAVSEIIS